MSVEIYIDDLKPDIQRQVLEELGARNCRRWEL